MATAQMDPDAVSAVNQLVDQSVLAQLNSLSARLEKQTPKMSEQVLDQAEIREVSLV
jgi:hypothetical protein